MDHDSSRLTALVGDGWRPLVFTDNTSDHQMVRRIAKEHGVVKFGTRRGRNLVDIVPADAG